MEWHKNTRAAVAQDLDRVRGLRGEAMMATPQDLSWLTLQGRSSAARPAHAPREVASSSGLCLQPRPRRNLFTLRQMTRPQTSHVHARGCVTPL